EVRRIDSGRRQRQSAMRADDPSPAPPRDDPVGLGVEQVVTLTRGGQPRGLADDLARDDDDVAVDERAVEVVDDDAGEIITRLDLTDALQSPQPQGHAGSFA